MPKDTIPDHALTGVPVKTHTGLLTPKHEPINRQAARVIGAGTHFDKTRHFNPYSRYWDSPPKLKTPDKAQSLLMGIVFGRGTKVIGVSDDAPKGYICRCACGVYIVRSAKAIKNQKNSVDCCEGCRDLLHKKRNQYRLQTGRDVAYEELC